MIGSLVFGLVLLAWAGFWVWSVAGQTCSVEGLWYECRSGALITEINIPIMLFCIGVGGWKTVASILSLSTGRWQK